MAKLEQYVVETPCGEILKLFATSKSDAEQQALQKINFKNTLVHGNSIRLSSKFKAS